MHDRLGLIRTMTDQRRTRCYLGNRPRVIFITRLAEDQRRRGAVASRIALAMRTCPERRNLERARMDADDAKRDEGKWRPTPTSPLPAPPSRYAATASGLTSRLASWVSR